MRMLSDMLLVLQYHAVHVACCLRSAGRIIHLKHEDLYMD